MIFRLFYNSACLTGQNFFPYTSYQPYTQLLRVVSYNIHYKTLVIQRMKSVAIVGAGVSGLSTAYALKQSGVIKSITVIADKFYDETLSYGAGGFFRPDEDVAETQQIAQQWFSECYKYFLAMSRTPDAQRMGIKRLFGYTLSSYSRNALFNDTMKLIFADLKDMSESERKAKFPAKYKYGMSYTSLIVDPKRYLVFLKEELEKSGKVTFLRKRVSSFDELAKSNYDVIVNCTGLESKTLCGDYKMVPIRGQAIKVKAPWINNFYYADGFYILPGYEWVTLGGIKGFSDSNLGVSDLDKKRIWETCLSIEPSLKDAEPLMDFVGLRPYRQPIRVEIEQRFGDRPYWMVHNYGHGGQGVNVSYATAQEAKRLCLEVLNRSPSKY